MTSRIMVLVLCLPCGAAPLQSTTLGAAAPVSASKLDSTERALAARVDEQRAARTVRELVAFGPRMGGTTSGAAAAQYLAEEFRRLGLSVEERLDRELWVHEEHSWSLTLHIAEPAGERELALESAWPWGYSPAASGRVALFAAPTAGAAQLQRGRPKLASGPEAPACVLMLDATTLDGSYPRISELSARPDNPCPVFGLSKPDGDRIERLLESGAELELEFALDSAITRARPCTIVAELAACDAAPAGAFLFCAHGDSDSGGPGANDNGSGIAIVLEIARAWSAALAAGEVERPARALRFAIWGREIHSSTDYAADLDAGGRPLLGVLNFDQAGFGSTLEQLNLEPDDLPANASFLASAIGLLRDAQGEALFPIHWATNKSLGGTDSYIFSRSTAFKSGSRPALTLFTSAWGQPDEHPRTKGMPGEAWHERELVALDYDLYYHSAGDTPANTTDKEPHNMAWCARVGMLSARRWLEAR